MKVPIESTSVQWIAHRALHIHDKAMISMKSKSQEAEFSVYDILLKIKGEEKEHRIPFLDFKIDLSNYCRSSSLKEICVFEVPRSSLFCSSRVSLKDCETLLLDCE